MIGNLILSGLLVYTVSYIIAEFIIEKIFGRLL
jgi:hypothetical protein